MKRVALVLAMLATGAASNVSGQELAHVMLGTPVHGYLSQIPGFAMVERSCVAFPNNLTCQKIYEAMHGRQVLFPLGPMNMDWESLAIPTEDGSYRDGMVMSADGVIISIMVQMNAEVAKNTLNKLHLTFGNPTRKRLPTKEKPSSSETWIEPDHVWLYSDRGNGHYWLSLHTAEFYNWMHANPNAPIATR